MPGRFTRELAELFAAAHVAITELRGDQPELIGATSGLAPLPGISGDAGADVIRLYQSLARSESVVIDDLSVSAEGAHIKAYRAGLCSLLQIGYRAIDGSLAGAITLGSERRSAFSGEHAQLLRELADIYTLAMARARVRATPVLLRHPWQPRQIDVAEVIRTLNDDEPVDEVVAPVVRTILELFDADECAISINREGHDPLLLRIDRTGGHLHPDESAIRPWQGESDHGSRSDSQQPSLPDLQDFNMRSEMFARVGPLEAALGSIHVWSLHPGRYQESDSRELYYAVQPLSAVLRYFEGRRKAEARARQLERVNRVLAALSAGGTPDQLSREFLVRCRNMLNAAMTAIIRYEDGDSSGSVMQQDCGAWDVAFPSSMALAEVEPGFVAHPAAPAPEESEPHPFSAQLRRLGLYSVVTAPLFVKGTLFGAVAAWGEGVNRFTNDDAETLGAVAGPFAIALEKAAALESLAESERRYRTLVSSAEEMIFLFDADSRRILDGNDFAARTLGYTSEELFSLRIDDFFDGEPFTLTSDIAALLEQGELHITDRRYRRSNGSAFDVDIVASAITYDGRAAILTLARDVSEQRSLQRQLVQSQKMESLGSMAGMVAHDFNNLLTTILGFAGLLKRSATLDIDERENLSMIEDAARRAADLTGRLLSFARGGLARFGPVDLREVITDTLHLAQTAIPQSIKITTDLPAGRLNVEGDSGQLQSAILNIVFNAKDAMPDGGHLHIALSELDSAARLTISDTGTGMDEETRTRMFEPFYTTKPAGSGTGLGMSITYGIVQGHHGSIDVQSAQGQGTCFTLTFPTVHAAPPAAADPHVPAEGTLILIVDDDEMVRRSTSATLLHLGYNVVQAASGATAIELVRARPERFAAVLLDLVMPGLTGSETFRAVSAIRPDLPVIICTGYAAEAHIDIDVKRRIAGLIQKPFGVERLTAMLSVVGAPPPRAG